MIVFGGQTHDPTEARGAGARRVEAKARTMSGMMRPGAGAKAAKATSMLRPGARATAVAATRATAVAAVAATTKATAVGATTKAKATAAAGTTVLPMTMVLDRVGAGAGATRRTTLPAVADWINCSFELISN